MGKFNESAKGIMKTTNLAGGESYKIRDLRLKVAIGVMTSFVNEKKFYGDNTNELLNDIRQLISLDPKFVSNLAIYTRKEMYMRSVTQMMIVELANNNRSKQYVREVCRQAIVRVDDMTEIMAYQLKVYGKPIPNSLKKGLADAFWKFDEYGFAKYNRDGVVKLKDLVALINPSPKFQGCIVQDRYDIIEKIYKDNLTTPQTWEVILSDNDGRSKREKWEEVIDMWIKVED